MLDPEYSSAKASVPEAPFERQTARDIALQLPSSFDSDRLAAESAHALLEHVCARAGSAAQALRCHSRLSYDALQV